MLGPGACRPSDVITIRGGKTVELNNPDAEGRIVMADGLALAAEKKPDLIIDIATLTGAAVTAPSWGSPSCGPDHSAYS